MSHDMLLPPTPRTDKACACVKPVGTYRQEWNEFAAANNFAQGPWTNTKVGYF